MMQLSCKNDLVPDKILVNGKIVTMDSVSTISEAVAIKGDRIVATGNNEEIRKIANRKTEVIDLEGRTAVPGLIDGHLHPESASVSELAEEIPDLHTIDELLSWIREQASGKPAGAWIIMPKLFSTRLAELRQPTLEELDNAAPEHPVFLNGSFGGMINSQAMKVSGITGKTGHPGVLKDRKTGKPTGFIRASAFRQLKLPGVKKLTRKEEKKALADMLHRYNRFGFTSLISGSGDFESLAMYREMADEKSLTARICQNILLPVKGDEPADTIRKILKGYPSKTGEGDEWVRTGSLKVFLDGGILTGTAYLQEPWGDMAREIFFVDDPAYRGICNFSYGDLLRIVTVANEFNWSFTVHATGGGSVDLILDVYDAVDKLKSIKNMRFSIIHGNFWTEQSIERMKKLRVYANSQAAWFYKDADAMQAILGPARMNSFHPYRTMIDKGIIVNGGSDHMVMWDADASINPYNPFIAIWSMITRKTEKGSVMLPSEAVTREEALKMYTINNAFATFEESLKGSIEKGKLADIAVLSDDLLTCPADNIKNIESVLTIVGGKVVYKRSGH